MKKRIINCCNCGKDIIVNISKQGIENKSHRGKFKCNECIKKYGIDTHYKYVTFKLRVRIRKNLTSKGYFDNI